MHVLFDPIDAEDIASLDDIAVTLRERLPWLWEDAFRIGPHEGYDGATFGAKAGLPTDTTASNVLHEVAHAIELTRLPQRVWRRRVKRPNFEMRIRSYQDTGWERHYEPQTLQATERECRVGGIQLRLLEMGGFSTEGFINDFVYKLKYTADSHMGGKPPLNLNPDKPLSRGHVKWQRRRKVLLMESYRQFTPEEIVRRWQEVMAWLSQQPEPSGTEMFSYPD